MSPLVTRRLLIAISMVALPLWWINSAENSRQAVPQDNRTANGTLIPNEPQPGTPSDGSEAVDSPGPEPLAHRPAPQENDVIARFEALHRYQGGTQAVDADDYDLLNPGARYERRRPVSRNPLDAEAEWNVLLSADRFFITDEEFSTLNLRLWQGDDPAAITVESASAVIQDDQGQTLTMPLGVLYAGDEALIRLRPSDYWPDLAGPLKVELSYSSFGLGTEYGRLDFHYTGPDRIPAEFIDVLTDDVVAGNLEFDIALDVRRSGRYRISALLHSEQGTPFGRAQTDVWLEPDQQTVKLAFDGLLFHDKSTEGSFYLTTLRGERLDPMSWSGSDQMPMIEGQYQTRRYVAAEFRNEVLASPHRERMRKHYENAIARGVRFEPTKD